MDDATVKLINEEFVPLAAPLGYGRVLTPTREEVAPACDAHKIPNGPEDGNNPFAPQRLKTVLAKFKMMPAEKREPSVDWLPADWWKAQKVAQPPKGGLILRQYVRRLTRDANKKLGQPSDVEHDFLWMTEAEWRSLVPKMRAEGAKQPVPAFLVRRIGRHHSDALEASLDVRLKAEPAPSLTMTVESASADQLRLCLEGSFRVVVMHHQEKEELAPADIAYRLHGYLCYDVKKDTFTRFDVAVLGEVIPKNPDGYSLWPRDNFSGKLFKDQTLMAGLFFELSPGDSPFERLPPSRAAFGGLAEWGYWK